MLGCLHNKQERKYRFGKNRCPYPYPLSRKIFFVEEIFTRTCLCDFVVNSRKCIFRKIKSRQKHCENKVKEHLMDVKTTT